MTATPAGPVIVGAGLAGLTAALGMAAHGVPCTLLTARAAGEATSSALAQGGLAAALGPGDDPKTHAADTLAAGAGLVDPQVAARITAAAPAVVARLLDLGADLDRDAAGALRLGLEGAHSHHRIVHADGDGSGREMTRALVAAVAAEPLITLAEHTHAVRILTRGGRVVGVLAAGPHGPHVFATGAVTLATGGAGALFTHTTNPTSSWGAGLALGLHAGAAVRDLELVQFHPTALDAGGDPMTLISEAVRGEGAALVDAAGRPVLHDPLAARDVVSRAVWAARRRGPVYLQTPTLGAGFAHRFPAITAACRAAGLDPGRDPLPVRPAAHYHMGGLAVDRRGRTGVPGLWAVGEVASTGLHGANRLASNSLLEALACGQWVADDIADHPHTADPAAAHDAATGLEPTPATPPTPADRLRLEEAAGVLRDGPTLARAAAEFTDGEPTDARLLAALMCRAALSRTESRGAHHRTDHPGTTAPTHTLLTLADLNRTTDHRSAS